MMLGFQIRKGNFFNMVEGQSCDWTIRRAAEQRLLCCIGVPNNFFVVLLK